ncbi:BON domain-containing protein [Flavobacterium terrigena]|uniref:BON domain-containing protein n=1 Tax=Flavobacterium terrigena TaxID=402734 RepID=A0A1H6QF23_9FLAO|nr:BON domain-containing protein [Flavobacterium terrigena]SEI40486.1 BON domain-containing protein [Flavobacterium terrigena]
MKTDEILQKKVQEALKWEPQLNDVEIGVIAEDGIVTLSGIVDNYYKKNEAENAVNFVSNKNCPIHLPQNKIENGLIVYLIIVNLQSFLL